jgi:hypothetical protein
MSADLLRLLELYASYLLTAMFEGNGVDDIELLIADLIERLMGDCELLAVDEHDRKDAILLYMLGERNGDTLRGRVEKRVRTFVNEVTAVFIAGKLMDMGYNKMLQSIRVNLQHPWENEILVEARKQQEKGLIDSKYNFTAPHYGQGNPVSSLTALDRMLVYAVADAWTEWKYEDSKDRGAKGFYVERGSSYPCEECDSHTNIYYDIDDEANKPQYHLNCRCLTIYVYQ